MINRLQNIIEHKHFKRLIVFVDQAMVSGINFLLGILLVRWLGLEEYGVFALCWMVVLFAMSLGMAFVSKPMLSIAPSMGLSEKRSYFQELHFFHIVLSVLIVAISFAGKGLTTYFFEKEIVAVVPILGALIATQLLHDFYRKMYFSNGNSIQAMLLDSILYPGQIIVLLYFYFNDQLTLATAILSILIANICSVLMGAASMGVQIPSKIGLKKTMARHFEFSKWLLGTAMLQWLSGNYFIIAAASILGPIAVGAVRMVQNIMGLCHVLFLAMENFLPVEAARLYKDTDKHTVWDYLKKISWKFGAGFSGILLLVVLFSAPLLQLLYGEESAPYAYIVNIYCVLYIFVFAGHPFRFLLRTIEQTKPMFIAYVLSTVFSLLLAFPIIRYFEMNGLLAGLIITQLIALFTYIYYTNYYLKQPDLKKKEEEVEEKEILIH